MNRVLFFLLVALIMMSACGEDRSLEHADRLEVNEWIYSIMEEKYLYASSMSFPERSWYATPEYFFQAVRVSSEARSGTYISQLYYGAEPSYEKSYGYLFDYYAWDNQYCLRVVYVAPGSPAADAGLKRGDWILGFDGKLIGPNNYTELSDTDGGAHELVIGKKTGYDSDKKQPIIEEEKVIVLPAARRLTASPVEVSEVLEQSGRKVGYLMYTRFESAPGGVNSLTGEYNEDLRSALAGFAAEGVQEMILDLRYSTGDAYLCTQFLGSMLAPRLYMDSLLFIRTGRTNPSPYFLNLSITGGTNLDLSSLYIISSTRTQGAAELLMKSLSPYMKVVIIGGRTLGYDLLSESFSDNPYGVVLKLATQILLDSREGTYSSGINPKVTVSEKDSLEATVYDFGYRQEVLLRRTLEVMSDSIAAQYPVPEEPEEPDEGEDDREEE